MKTLTVEELEQMRRQQDAPPLINVLSRQQFEEAHIPGSVNVPVSDGEFLGKVEKLVDSGDPVVVYCASTECNASPEAAEKLEEAGFEEVYDFEGGMKAWREAGKPLEGSRDAT